MSAINSDIGTNARDHMTFTLWEAADGDGDGLGNDDVTGTVFNDSVFDETFTINFSALSILLTSPVGERHTGIINTGSRLIRTATSSNIVTITVPTTWEFFDISSNSNETRKIIEAETSAILNIFKNMFLHDTDSGVDNIAVGLSGANIRCTNLGIYRLKTTRATSSQCVAYQDTGGNPNIFELFNCTGHSFINDNGTGKCVGADLDRDLSNRIIKNCLLTDTSGTSSGIIADYNSDAGEASIVANNNLSSDATAFGSSPQINKSADDIYVNKAAGSEDLRQKAGSPSIDNGVILGTSPTDVERDINELNRDTDPQGPSTDIGFHEFVPVISDNVKDILFDVIDDPIQNVIRDILG